VLCSYSHKTGEFIADHIAIITPCAEQPFHPRVWVLNKAADAIMVERTIELYLKGPDKSQQAEPAPKEEKESKKKGKKKGDGEKETKKDGGAFDRKGSTGSLDGETTGNISCISVREMKRKNPQASAIQIMNQVNKINNTGAPE